MERCIVGIQVSQHTYFLHEIVRNTFTFELHSGGRNACAKIDGTFQKFAVLLAGPALYLS